MKYSELNSEAQRVAQQSYQIGWNETHPNETFTAEQLHEFCLDCDIYIDYQQNGEVIGHE